MPSNKIILGIVGEIAAGKGLVAEYLKEKYGAVAFRFSTPLREVAGRLYLEQSRQNLQTLSTILRQAFGNDLLDKVAAKDIAGSKAEMIIVEGIRRTGDIAELAKSPDFHLIAVAADERTRFERIKARNENEGDADKTWEQFQKDARAEADITIRGVAAQAEFTIDNNGDLPTLRRAIDDIISKIKKTAA